MSDFGELSGSLGMKAAMQRLDQALEKRVEPETREAIVNSIEMMYEYIPYTIKQGKNPTDGKVLAEFLAGKGAKMSKYLGSSPVNCAAAIVEFLLSSKNAYASTATGFPPAITLAYGLALLDLIEVGNQCEPAQQAYYDLFLKTSSVKLNSIRTQVAQQYAP